MTGLYRKFIRRLCGSEFAMQERNWQSVLKTNAEFAAARDVALCHLDRVALNPADNADWERVAAAIDALCGRSSIASAGDDGVFV